MTSPPSRLGSKIAGAAPQAAPASSSKASSSPSRLAKRRTVSGRRGALRTLPELGEAYIELPGATRWAELEAAAHKEAARLAGDSPDPTRFAFALEAQTALRVLAVACREPSDHGVPIGSLEEWGELDNDLVNAAWHVFGDVRDELDPVSQPLTEDEMSAIASAVKKKDGPTLRAYGLAKLSAWLCFTGGPSSTSPQPSSPNTDSLEAS